MEIMEVEDMVREQDALVKNEFLGKILWILISSEWTG